MSVLKASSIKARCDVCKLAFDPVYGGICVDCGRLLCPRHLYGGMGVRLLSLFGIRRPCPDCRARRVGRKGGDK